MWMIHYASWRTGRDASGAELGAYLQITEDMKFLWGAAPFPTERYILVLASAWSIGMVAGENIRG